MGRSIRSGHWFSLPINAVNWRYVLLFWVAALVVVSASPTLIAQGNYDQQSGLGRAMSPQEAGGATGPQEGPPGFFFTVTGAGFLSYTAIQSIQLGGIHVLGDRIVNTDIDGGFIVEGLVVPELDPGRYALVVKVGTGIQETTVVTVFEVTSGSLSAGLAPLLDSDNLVRLFYFQNSTKEWLFYDSRPEFADSNTLKELRNGEIYWLNVRRDQEVTLNGKTHKLSCTGEGTASENCWNQMVW